MFYGPLSDRFGRKKPLYAGLAIYTLASIGAAFAPSIPALIVCRFLQGMGGCAGIIIPSAIVRDRTTARESARAFSLLMLVMGLAPILAPLIGWLPAAIWAVYSLSQYKTDQKIADALDMEIQRLDELHARTNQVGFIGRLKSDSMPVLEECFSRVKLG